MGFLKLYPGDQTASRGRRARRKEICRMIFLCMFCFLLGFAGEIQAATKEARAEEILAGMTMKEKIAQMFLVVAPAKDAVKVQKKYQFGGYVFFAGDFAGGTPKSTKKKMKYLQNASKIKMLLAVDEEGGTVVRISRYKAYRKTPFGSPQSVYKKGGYAGVKKDTAAKDTFLKALGLNTNLAPVADTPYKKTDFIYKRSFSTSASKVSKYITTVVKQMKKDQVVSVLKHFPGYGGNGDTHTNIIRDKRTKKTFVNRDLKPFAAGIAAGNDMVMVSHNIVNAFDKKNPASLSKKVHQYLRKDMKFDGVIVTDDLAMEGAAGLVKNAGDAAVKAILAGNDMLATRDYKEQYEAVYQAYKKGKITKKQINASVKRILLMKLNRGIIR